jgi:hypothetical protein
VETFANNSFLIFVSKNLRLYYFWNMSIKSFIFAASLLTSATFLFAGGSQEVPVNSEANETEVSIESNEPSPSSFPRWFTAGIRLSGGFFSFTGAQADYVGWKHPGSAMDVGPFFRFHINRIFEIDPSIAFGYRYHQYKRDDYSLTFQEYLIQVPVVARVFVYDGFFVGAGGQFAAIVDSKNKSTSYGIQIDFDSANPEFGGIVELGYSFSHFAIDARLYAAASDYANNDIIGKWKGLTYRPLIVSLGATYLF